MPTPSDPTPTSAYGAYARAALPVFGLPPGAALTLVNHSENATYRVDLDNRTLAPADPASSPAAPTTTSGGRFALRVHRQGYHSRAAVESELAWLTAVRTEAGIGTPVVVPTLDGRPVAEVVVAGRPRQCVLFEWLPGAEPPADELGQRSADLGALTARLHGHSLRWRRPDGFSRFAWDLPATLGPEARWGRWQDRMALGRAECDVLARASSSVAQRLGGFGMGPDVFGLVHADLRLANLLVEDDDIAILDFDDCGWGWHLYDLAAAMSFHEADPRLAEWVDGWLSGYRSQRWLSPEAEAMVPTFVVFRRLILLAWLGSHAHTALARELGPAYTVGSADLAESYLRGTLLS